MKTAEARAREVAAQLGLMPPDAEVIAAAIRAAEEGERNNAAAEVDANARQCDRLAFAAEDRNDDAEQAHYEAVAKTLRNVIERIRSRHIIWNETPLADPWRKWPDVHPPKNVMTNLEGKHVGYISDMVLVAALSTKVSCGIVLLLANYSYVEEKWVFEAYEDGEVGSYGYDADDLTVHCWAPIPDTPDWLQWKSGDYGA